MASIHTQRLNLVANDVKTSTENTFTSDPTEPSAADVLPVLPVALQPTLSGSQRMDNTREVRSSTSRNVNLDRQLDELLELRMQERIKSAQMEAGFDTVPSAHYMSDSDTAQSAGSINSHSSEQSIDSKRHLDKLISPKREKKTGFRRVRRRCTSQGSQAR